MHSRDAEITDFLASAGWGDATSTPIAGDMSSRRYARLEQAGQSAILMNADSDMTAFANMTDWLASVPLSVPALLESDPKQGLLLLEDFGEVSLKSALVADPTLKESAFELCFDALLDIRKSAPPVLSSPGADELVDWTSLADAHVEGLDTAALSGFREVLRENLEVVLRTPPTVSLRDFHTENVMWLPERSGVLKLGLLDYQDAFLTHPVYDVVSLLTDARTWISTAFRQTMIERYLAKSNDSPDAFRLAFATLSAQRNLRILGIFARAGKHLDSLKPTFGYFAEALAHPSFKTVRADTLSAFPCDLVDA